MAFVTPPTFVDGDVLTAAQLNILADNQLYLAGLDAGVQIGFRQVTISGDTSQYYYVVYSDARPWLYVRVALADDDSTLRVYWDGDPSNAIHEWGTLEAGGETVTDAIDLSSDGITNGAFIELRFRGVSGGTAVLEYWAMMSEDIT